MASAPYLFVLPPVVNGLLPLQIVLYTPSTLNNVGPSLHTLPFFEYTTPVSA